MISPPWGALLAQGYGIQQVMSPTPVEGWWLPVRPQSGSLSAHLLVRSTWNLPKKGLVPGQLKYHVVTQRDIHSLGWWGVLVYHIRDIPSVGSPFGPGVRNPTDVRDDTDQIKATVMNKKKRCSPL